MFLCNLFIGQGQGCSRQLFIICSVNLANTYFCPLIIDRNNIFIFPDGNRTIFSGSSNDFSTLYFKGECCYNGIAIRSSNFSQEILAIRNIFQLCTDICIGRPDNAITCLRQNISVSQCDLTQIYGLTFLRCQLHFRIWQVDSAGFLDVNVILVDDNGCSHHSITNCKTDITFCSIVIEVAICCICVNCVCCSCSIGNCSIGQRKGCSTFCDFIRLSIGFRSKFTSCFCQGVIAVRQSLDNCISTGRNPLNTNLLLIFIQNSGFVCQCHLAPINIIFRSQGQGCTCKFRLLCDVIFADDNRRFLRVVSSQLRSPNVCINDNVIIVNLNIFSCVIRQNDLTVCVDSKEDWVHNCIIFRSGGFYQNIFRIFYEISSDFVCNVFFNCSQSRFLSVLICFICKFGIDCKFCTRQGSTVLVCKVFLDQCPCNTYSLVGNGNCTSRSSIKATIQQHCTINSSTVRTIYSIINGIFAVCTI